MKKFALIDMIVVIFTNTKLFPSSVYQAVYQVILLLSQFLLP